MKVITPLLGLMFMAGLAMFFLPQLLSTVSTTGLASDQQDALNLFPTIWILLGALAAAGITLAVWRLLGAR